MKKSVSLVLGSGGARGYAHIGVIEVLEDLGYKIESIAGSSMGALIGGLYACGKLNTYKEWVLALDVLDVLKLVDFTIGKIGIIKGDRVFSIMEEMIGTNNIEELPIAFTAVATDLINQREVWLQKGRLTVAVRASIAIPGILTPVEMENKVLVDGGVLNPVPIGPTLPDTTDLTIAVNLNSATALKHQVMIHEMEKKRQVSLQSKISAFLEQKLLSKEAVKGDDLNYIKIFRKTIETMQNVIARHEISKHHPHVVIEIPSSVCSFYDFHKAYEIIELGRRIARETLMKLTN